MSSNAQYKPQYKPDELLQEGTNDTNLVTTYLINQLNQINDQLFVMNNKMSEQEIKIVKIYNKINSHRSEIDDLNTSYLPIKQVLTTTKGIWSVVIGISVVVGVVAAVVGIAAVI